MANIRITKRKDVYQYRFEIASENGKRKYINKSGFKTKAEAMEAGNIAYTEYINAGKPFKECKMSYSDYLDYWINNYCKTNLKYNTIQTYTTLSNKYIKPYIGHYRMCNITSITLNTFVTNLVNQYDFSRDYFRNILKIVKGSFRDATNLYGFIKYNPALTIRIPKMDIEKKEEKHLYTKEEIDLIINKFKDDSTFICAFLTACFTGMRTGELFALTWEDIDLDNGLINIKHSVYDKPKDKHGRWYIGTTKTISGQRKVYIGETLKETLKNYKQRQQELKRLYGKEYKYYHIEEVKNEYGKVIEHRIVLNKTCGENILDLVFVRDNGTYSGTDLLRYPFKIIHKELGIEKCRFYDLRGSYATKILNNGTKIKEVADLLGHSNVETTENYYIRSLENNKRIAVNEFDSKNTSDVIKSVIGFQIKEGEIV